MNNISEMENVDGDIEENLLKYCRSGNYKQVVYIFDKFHETPGFDINCRDMEKSTPLILSVRQGHGTIAQELLRYMPDITLVNSKGHTAIDLATNPIMKLIFGCVSTCKPYSDRMFCNACWLGNIEVVERCVARDRSLIPRHLANLDGLHCLLLPVINLSLLERAATQIKCQYKPAQVLQSLLTLFTTIPDSCRTLLHTVAKSTSKSSLEVARVLLHRSFDALVIDDHGFTAVHVAARFGNAQVLDLLLTRSKYETARIIDVMSRSGNTPLHLAAMEGREDCVKLLLRYGASKDIINENGHTPMQQSKNVRIKNLFQAPEKTQRSIVLPESGLVLTRSNTALPRTPCYTPLHFGKKSAEPFHRSKENILDFKDMFVDFKEPDILLNEHTSFSSDNTPLQLSSIKFPLIAPEKTRRKFSHSVSLECLEEEITTETTVKQLDILDKEGPALSRNNLNNGKLVRPTKAITKTVNKRRIILPQKPKTELPKPQKSKLTPSLNKAMNQKAESKRKPMKSTKDSVVCEIALGMENIDHLSDNLYEYESDFNTDNSSSHEDPGIQSIENESNDDDEDEDFSHTLNNSEESPLMSSHIRWRKGEQLGKGSYGTVWKGMLDDGQYIAVKEIMITEEDELSEISVNNSLEIKREIDILHTLRHRNIVKYLGACDSHTCIHILMEFVSGGSIAYILTKFGGFSENIVKRYSRQMVEAISFLNDNGVIHRDIKGANVMVTPKGVIKLIDFGCAKRMQHLNSISLSVQQQSRLHGSVYWMAPEVINGSCHSHKSDVWSLGCTVIEMFTTRPPWADLHPFAAMFSIGSGSRAPPDLKGYATLDGTPVSGCAVDFVNMCLTRDRSVRPKSADLLLCAFLKGDF